MLHFVVIAFLFEVLFLRVLGGLFQVPFKRVSQFAVPPFAAFLCGSFGDGALQSICDCVLPLFVIVFCFASVCDCVLLCLCL
jgi:hypothetical protein